jgi:NAD(P)-dependent dehydrogenase (short-subunit alcohol dehydrogenase family)
MSFHYLNNFPNPIYSSDHSQSDYFWENKTSLTKHRDTYPFIDPHRFKNSLKGKVVVITLAHRGIGSASAKSFAAAGASVALVGPSAQALDLVQKEIKEKYQTPTIALTANPLDSETPKRIVELVETHLGPIDILLNITPPSYLRPFAQEKDIGTDWWRSLELNVRAPIALIHAVLPSMTARQTGIIISTTAAAATLHIPFSSVQGVSKAALLKFHHQLDVEIRPKGIFSYAVHPGLIPAHLHDPDDATKLRPEDYVSEPRMKTEVMDVIPLIQWDAVGLATGTFVALCADERARVLSGKYVNAGSDLGEVIELAERDWKRIERERLYVLKVDEF